MPDNHRSILAGSGAEALRNAGSYLGELATPVLRLGVTGLSRSGKTVFIAALVRNLVEGGRLPFLRAKADGRLIRAYLEPQPDDDLPRFDIEDHLAALAGEPPAWPQSTSRISQLRLTLDYQPAGQMQKMLSRLFGTSRLHVDIIDYPGEWLLDLALLDLGYAAWSHAAVEAARKAHRRDAAAGWLAELARLDPAAKSDEAVARKAAATFTAFLQAARAHQAVATLGPGRFLLPGELAGSPLLTFVPLDLAPDAQIGSGSLAAMMERRFESYKRDVVRPFFARHFGRLDRQIVLVDALAAIDGGADAIEDLTVALTAAFTAFRTGRNNLASRIFAPRIERILFAATKADHLPRSSHDHLENALTLLTERAMARARYSGADVKTLAMAALRATREVDVKQGGETLPCIAGVPLAGEVIGGKTFDGRREAVVFPGDLPADPAAALMSGRKSDVRIIRFAPPRIAPVGGAGNRTDWPHIRLDRALDYLIGDRLA